MCNLLEGSYLNVGLQSGGTDGATSFTRWLKFHGSIFLAFPREKARQAKRDFSIREENAITATYTNYYK